MRWMPVLYGVTAGLSSLVLVELLVWIVHFRGGLAWQEAPALQFNWHPILMVVSLVVLYGHGTTIARWPAVGLSIDWTGGGKADFCERAQLY